MNITPEQVALYTRLCAEAEGYDPPSPDKVLNEYEAKNPDLDDWKSMWRSPSGGAWSYYPPPYSTDLNALRRVAVKICETEKGKKLLWHKINHAHSETGFTLPKSLWQACLPALELFQIYGETLVELNKEQS